MYLKNKEIELSELDQNKLFEKARRGHKEAQNRIIFGMIYGTNGFEKNPDGLFELSLEKEKWIQRHYFSIFFAGVHFTSEETIRILTYLGNAGNKKARGFLMRGLKNGQYYINPCEEKYNHLLNLNWSENDVDPYEMDQDFQKKMIDTFVKLDMHSSWFDIFQMSEDHPWIKDWYHYIFTSNLYDKEFAKGRLIDLAEEGDSQARQMLSAAYFKGVYHFEQDFDKFKELCDLGWHEALEIKKKFFDCFDNCQIEKTN